MEVRRRAWKIAGPKHFPNPCNQESSEECRLTLPLNNLHSPHIWTQSIRDNYGTIPLLIILEYGQPRSADGQTRAVQCMEMLALPVFAAISNIRASSLKSFEIAAG